ncbi:hypothetical protein GCM10009087_26460 [Sphingomonas oligophenolica]|uniref:M48 family metallopeptidase n=1 Tax=Sphingomonas oligophenolica TaxID=301154 RepID=A0ABU9YCS9_9SPHN
MANLRNRIMVALAAALLMSAAASGDALPSPVAAPPPSVASDDTVTIRALEGLRAADIRLGSIIYRLARANVALCNRRSVLTGLLLHSLPTYSPEVRDVAKRHFAFASPIAVEGVVPDSPAALADIRMDDSLVALDRVDLTMGTLDLATVNSRLEASPQARAIGLDLLRRSDHITRQIVPVTGCAGHAEVRVTAELNAATDGMTIQVNSGLMNLLTSDDDLAALVAHELAHIILRHPERLTEAKVDRGILRDFGRNARLIRRTEIEADQLSVYLLANAGYDPAAAPHYLKTYGSRMGVNNILAGSTHPRGKERIKLMEAEVAKLAGQPSRPIIPAWVQSRALPLG